MERREVPASRVNPMASVLQAIDRGEDACEVLGVNRNDKAGASKASAKMRAQARGAVAAGNDRRETIVAEGNCCAWLTARRYRVGPV